MRGLIVALCAAIVGAQPSGDVMFLGTRCCIPEIGPCSADLPLCASLGCCDARFMTCPPGIRSCTIDPSVFCCDNTVTKCPADAPICEAAPTGKPSSTMCCDPARESCPSIESVCPDATCCNARLNQCPPDALVCGESTADCCNPAKERCVDFTMICPAAECCNPELNACPPEAPICGGAGAGAATVTVSVMPTFDSVECCDPNYARCPEEVPVCQASVAPTHKPSASPVEMSRRPMMSAAPTPRPTTLPLPTRFVRLAASPIPSRWPIRRSPLPPSIRPRVITSTLRFVGADKAIVTRPEKLQEMAIQIACTLRMPVEKIVIQTIYEITNGTRSNLPFDPAVLGLHNNGQVMCLKSNASVSRRQRRVQATMDGSVGVDYVVYDPSDDLVILDSSEFTAVVSSSTALQSYSTSVGASGMAVTAPQELAAAPFQPSPSATTATTNYGAIVGGSFAGLAVMAGAFLIHKLRTGRRTRILASPVQSTFVMNPTASVVANDSMRGVFAPTTIRVGGTDV